MTTTPSVIRDDVDPLVVTTKFDVNHEYDGEADKPVLTHVDITAALYVHHGDSAIKLDFGVFGDPDADYLRVEFVQQLLAIDALVDRLVEVRNYLVDEHKAIRPEPAPKPQAVS